MIQQENFKHLIHDIDQLLLKEKGMRWVFVLDQIYKIVDRPECKESSEVAMLPFPFVVVSEVLKPDRIISIISAPENNDVSYRYNHSDFEDFDHPVQLHKHEIELLYSVEQVANWGDFEEIDYATGCVPWYLSRWTKDETTYYLEVGGEIQAALKNLEHQQGKV